MAEKNQTTKEGHQKKTGLAGKKHWIEKKVLKRSSVDVVVTQNEKGTSEDSTVSSEQHTDLSTASTWEPWNTSVDQSPNQLKPLASEGSNYNRLGENQRQQMKDIKAQHMETLKERHVTEEVSQSPRQPHTVNQPANTRDIMMMEYTNEPAAAGHVQSNQKKQKPMTQPLMPSVGITTDNSPQCLPGSIEEELSRLEIERDHYKRESEGKEQTIQQYKDELIQYKTKLRQYTSSQQKQSLEDETTQLKVKEAELKQKYDQDLQKKLEDKATELKQKYDHDLQEKLEDKETKLKQKYEKKLNQKEKELQQRNDDDVRNKEQLKKKQNEITALQQKFTAETANATDAIAERTLLEKRLKDIQKVKEKQEQAKTDLQQKLAEAKTETELVKKRCTQLEEIKQEKESLAKELEKGIEDRKEKEVLLKARVKHLQEELDKQKGFGIDKGTELEHEIEGKTRLAKENEDLKRESEQTAIQAAGRTKRLEDQLANKEQEVIKLTAINEERAIAHKEELERVNKQLEEIKEQLEEKCKLPHDGVEDGARATPNSSLTDEEKLKASLDMKDGEIQILNERIKKLEEENKNLRDTALTSQLEEFAKEKQQLESERHDLERKLTVQNKIASENTELKQRLLEQVRDAQGQEGVELKEAHQKLNKKDGEIIKLKDLVTKLEQQMTEQNNETQRLYLTVRQHEKQVEIVKAEKTKLGDQTKRLNEDNSRLKYQLDSKEKTQSNETQRLYQQYKSAIEQIEEMKKENEHLKEEITNLAKVTRSLEEENPSLKQQLESKEKAKIDIAIKLQQSNDDYDKLVGEKSQQLQELQDKLDERNRQNQQLQNSLEVKSESVQELKDQLIKSIDEHTSLTKHINFKQKTIEELTTKLQLLEQKNLIYREDFNRERNDRAQMHSTLTNKLDKAEVEVKELKEKLQDLEHEKTHLNELNKKLNDDVGTLEPLIKALENESDKLKIENKKQRDDLMKQDIVINDWEEEKLVLTSQVNGYSRQCDELKKTLLQIQNKCKSLEDQLKHKTGLETEINQLKSQLQHKVTEIEKLKVRCSETEDNFKKSVAQLQQELQSECADKQHLLSAFRQEQVKVANLEDEMIKMRNANKILMEKVSSQKILPVLETPGHNVGYPPAHEITNISQRRNYPHQSTSDCYPVQQAMTATNNTNADIVIAPGQVHVYKEQLSGSYDIPPPQMNIEQMREFGRKYDNPQREQQEEQRRRQQMLQQMEQQRQIEQARADKELEELEQLKLEQKRMEARKSLPYQHQSNVTRNDELVSGTSKPVTSESDTSDDIPENPLIEGIDQDIQYYAEEAREMTRPPNDTKELDVQDSLPYDPNLVCPKCGKRYRIGQIQRFKRHVEERCPNRNK